MNVKNETARILRAHAERAASANARVKIYFKLYIDESAISTPFFFVLSYSLKIIMNFAIYLIKQYIIMDKQIIFKECSS